MKVLIASILAVTTLPAAAAAAGEITVEYSQEFQEKLEDDYGLKEGTKLSSEIREDMQRELKKVNIDPARISVTIVDAKPNRPTMKQLSDKPGLDMLRSKSIGGMDLKGVAYDASGTAIVEFEYDWYETNIDQVHAASTWHDADRASSRFARKFADKLSGQ